MQFRNMAYAARLGAVAFMVVALLMAGSTSAAYAQDDVEKANKAVVTRFFQELINEENLDVIDELVVPGYVEHMVAEETVYEDPQTLKDEWAGILAEFSPVEVEIEDMMADGDRVITRFSASVKDGAAAWTGIGIHRLEDGQIVEYWEQADQLGMMTQLGMLPDPRELEANKAVLRRVVDEVFNQQNLDAVEELYAPNFVEHRFFGDFVAEDYAAIQDDISQIFSGMSDLQLEISDMIADGDQVMARFTETSEEAGVDVTGVYIARLEDGRIAEAWDYTDMINLFAQLGVIDLPQVPQIETIATGFNGPQGVLVDADGNVWVIDAGLGGDTEVEWINPDSGQLETAMMGDTAQVVRIGADGEQTVEAMLPSVAIGTDSLGGARLALLDGELYATVGQWLGDLGEDRMPLEAVVAYISPDGMVEEAGNTWDIEASDNPGGFVEDSHPYGLAAGPDGRLWVADAGGNDLLAIDPDTGEVTLEAVFDGIPGPMPNPARDGAMEMDPVPTGIAFDEDGTAYVSLLSGFPFVPGSTKVVTVDADGNVADFATGLTMLTDLRAGPDGNFYAVQFGLFTDQGPIPDSGAIIRVLEGDASEIVVDGLSFPTSVDFNDAGDAYITINSVGAPGSGEVVMVTGLTDLRGTPVAEVMVGMQGE